MDKDKLAAAANPANLGNYLAGLPMHDMHAANGRIETVREDDHEGHHIVVRTSYEIEVDGKPLDVPLGVDNDGNLHSHALPNYQFQSAIGLVKLLIDAFPGDFSPKPGSGGQGSGEAGGGQGGHGQMPGMPGM